jgi:hypothetical protein
MCRHIYIGSAHMTVIFMYCARALARVGSCHCVIYHQRRVRSTARRTLVFCGPLECCCTMQTSCCVVYARYSLRHLYRSSSHISPRMQKDESRVIALTDSPCHRPGLNKYRDTEDLIKQLASGRARRDANHVTRFVTKHLCYRSASRFSQDLDWLSTPGEYVASACQHVLSLGSALQLHEKPETVIKSSERQDQATTTASKEEETTIVRY